MIEDVYQWLETAGQVPDKRKVSLALDLVREELEELKSGLFFDNKEEVLDALEDLKWVLGNVAFFYGLSLEEIDDYERKVSISNWSKFCTTQDMAEVTVNLYKKGEHPDKLGEKIDCYYERVGQFWIVKRADGKILKSTKYLSVDQL